MEHQSSSQLLAYSSPCRRLGLSSSSSGEMSSSEGNDVPFSCHQQIFREADGVAPMERPIEDTSYASAPFGVDASSSGHQSSESFEPSPFLTITRANPISSYDSISNNDDRYGTITRGHSCCEDDDDMNYQNHQDIAVEQQDDVLRNYNTSTPSAVATGAAIDFSPFFRADPAPITPDASASTVVLNTDQSLLTTDQIQPNLFHSSSANNHDNTTLLLGRGQNGQRSFSPSGVTEIQNQQRGGGRGDGDAAHHRYHQGYTSKVAPTTPTISNVNSHVEDDTEQQQQQRSPFRARLYHDDHTQDQEGNNHNGSNLQYLHHPLIHASWTSTTDGSTVQLSASASASSSLLCSSTSAESCSFDASAAGGGQ